MTDLTVEEPVEVAFAIHPPRAGVMLYGLNSTPQADYLVSFKSLVDLQHEYPGETFYAICDTGAQKNDENHRSAVWEAATAALALGVEPDKAVLYCCSDLAKEYDLLDLFEPAYSFPGKHSSDRNRFCRESSDNLDTAIYPIGIRATVVASDLGINVMYKQIEGLVDRFNALCNAPVLRKPRMHRANAGHDEPRAGARSSNDRILPLPCANLKRDHAVHGLLSSVGQSFGSPTNIAKRHNISSPADTVGQSHLKKITMVSSEFTGYCARAAARYEQFKHHPSYVWDVLDEGAKIAKAQWGLTMAIFQNGKDFAWR